METKWRKHQTLFLCPICGKRMGVNNSSLICESNHCFDISRKGYLNVIQKREDKIYSAELFKSREQVYGYGFYDEVFNAIDRIIEKEISLSANTVILDAGCGEGSPLTRIGNRDGVIKVGVDISKDAIIGACKKSKEIIWLVADLVRIPLRNDSVDVICNFLSPAAYDSFYRILKASGILIKVTPGKSYLKELRATASFQDSHKPYDEQCVISYLEKNMKLIKKVHLEYRVEVTRTQLDQWIKMTPMLVHTHPCEMRDLETDKVTIDLIICVCKKKK